MAKALTEANKYLNEIYGIQTNKVKNNIKSAAGRFLYSCYENHTPKITAQMISDYVEASNQRTVEDYYIIMHYIMLLTKDEIARIVVSTYRTKLKQREYMKTHKDTNIERRREVSRRYYQMHREKSLQQKKEYYQRRKALAQS